MKRERFTLQTMGAVVLVALLLLPLVVAWFLSGAKSSGQHESAFVMNEVSRAIIRADNRMTASELPPDAPEEMAETITDFDLLDELPQPWEIQIGDFTVRTVRVLDDGQASLQLEVWKGSTLLYQEDGMRFEITSDHENEDGTTNAFFAAGANITGNGIPNLIVSEYSGGMHCCYTYYIFELGAEFRVIDEIEAAHGEIELIDVDHDGIPEIKMHDWSYAYVFGSFVSSPAPSLILRYTNGHYEIAPDLMQTPAPNADELQQMAEEIKSDYKTQSENGELSGEWPAALGLWGKMLDLIYGGHEDEARRLFDMVWPSDDEGKEETFADFAGSVESSLLWKGVQGSDEPTSDSSAQNEIVPAPVQE